MRGADVKVTREGEDVGKGVVVMERGLLEKECR